jgi:hypothetical protein
MAKVTFGLATEEDDGLLRNCLKNNKMDGAISLAFETEPSFFDALDIQGRESQVILVKDGDKAVGFGIRSIEPRYVDGKIEDVGYLSGLRGYPEYRNGTFLARGYRFLRELDQDGKVPFYLTTIIEDNSLARKILESGRVGLPNYTPLGVLSSSVIKPRVKKSKKKHDVVKGNELPLERIVDFLKLEGRNKQFFPCYPFTDFGSSRLRGLEQEDFYVAIDGEEIIGTLAKWGQEKFKQTRVIGYDKRLSIARPLINIASRFSNIPNLPRKGELLHHFYAALPVTKNNDPEILESLVVEVASDEKNQKYGYFTIGLMQGDPLREAIKSFKPRDYNSVLYAVTFDDSHKHLNFLNGRVPYLELGAL